MASFYSSVRFGKPQRESEAGANGALSRFTFALRVSVLAEPEEIQSDRFVRSHCGQGQFVLARAQFL